MSKIKLATPLLFATCFSPVVADAEITIIPRAEVGYNSYQLEFDGEIPTPTGNGVQIINISNSFNMNLASLRLGGSLAWNKLYMDAYYQGTTDASDTQTYPILNVTEKWTGSREEYNFTLGYSIIDGGSVFGGYRFSETTADGSIASDYSFEHEGYFIGASYGWLLTDTGALSINAAYAWLDVTLNENLLGFPLKADGDGTGVKLGVKWNDRINKEVGYSISVDWFNYDYDITTVGSGAQASMKEKEATIRLGIDYRF